MVEKIKFHDNKKKAASMKSQNKNTSKQRLEPYYWQIAINRQ